MNRLRLLDSLTTALALGAATPTERSKLATWIDEYTPKIANAVAGVFTPPFTWAELTGVADISVTAAQELKGVFAGADRAHIAQIVFVEVVRYVLPDGMIEDVAVSALNSEAVAGMIEAAYQRLFGPERDDKAVNTALRAITKGAALPGVSAANGQPVDGADSPVNAPADDAQAVVITDAPASPSAPAPDPTTPAPMLTPDEPGGTRE